MFVVIEGIDGSGKTTLINLLKGSLPNATFVRTPGGMVPEIRNLVMDPKNDLYPVTKMFMFLSEMIEIQKKYKHEELVICDRFFLSTFVYQVLENAQYLTKGQYDCAVAMFTNFLKPVDMTFILTVDIETATKRSASKSLEFGSTDSFESSDVMKWIERRTAYEHPERTPINYMLGKVEIIDTTNEKPADIFLKVVNKIVIHSYLKGGPLDFGEKMSEKAHEIYLKVTSDFDEVLRKHLSKENPKTRDYVEQRILDEYRPWDYMYHKSEDD